jgi:hypothetical protein
VLQLFLLIQASLFMKHSIVFRLTALAAAFAIVAQGNIVFAQPDPPANKNKGPKRTPTVYLHLLEDVGVGVSSIVARRIDSSLRDELTTAGEIDLRDRYEPGENMAGKRISDARQQYTSAIGLLRNEEFKKASTHLQKSVDIFMKRLENLRDFDVLADTYVNLAWAYYETGFDFDAKKYIHQYAHLRPDKQLDPKKFPNALIEEFEEEKRRIRQAGPGKVAVETSQKGLTVYLDGQQVGESPMVIEDVSYGTHYITVENGFKRAKVVDVKGRGKKQTVTFEKRSKKAEAEDKKIPAFYRGMRKHIRSGSIDRELKPYLDEMAKKTDSDYIIWSLVVNDPTGYRVLPFVYQVSKQKMVWVPGETFDERLQNLRAGTSELSKSITESVLKMPKSRVLKSIDVEIKREKEGDDVEIVRGGDKKGDSVKPPPSVEDGKDDSNVWTYVKIGGAAAAAGGLIAGGVIMFTGGDGGGVDRFNTEVTW